jgi:hypothetical protein
MVAVAQRSGVKRAKANSQRICPLENPLVKGAKGAIARDRGLAPLPSLASSGVDGRLAFFTSFSFASRFYRNFYLH